MGLVLARVIGDEVPDGPAEYARGRGETCVTIRRVAVLEHCTLKPVSVQGAIGVRVACDETLHRFDPHLGTSVAMGKGD